MTTGSRMKARRKELGIPVDKIASALGVSIATVYRYENGDIEKVPGSVLEPLSKVLCTTPSYLMGWDDDPINYDDGNLLAEIPLSYMEACDGDPKRAYAMMMAVDEDAKHSAFPASARVSIIKNPDIRMIARAGEKMTPEQAENLRKYAQYMFPEAFEDDK